MPSTASLLALNIQPPFCAGLINQQYSHIAAFALAAVLGAEVVLPPAAKRDSFGHYFSVFKEQNEVLWSAAPLESLMDTDRIVETWRVKGITVHKVPPPPPPFETPYVIVLNFVGTTTWANLVPLVYKCNMLEAVVEYSSTALDDTPMHTGSDFR